MTPMDTRSLLLPERSEGGAQLGGEKLWPFPGCEVAALVDLVEIDQVAIGAAGPCLRGAIDVLRKYGDGHRQRDLGSLPRGRLRGVASDVLPIQAPRRGRAVGEPVQCEVVKDLVFGRSLRGIVAVSPFREPRMHEQKCREAGRG